MCSPFKGERCASSRWSIIKRRSSSVRIPYVENLFDGYAGPFWPASRRRAGLKGSRSAPGGLRLRSERQRILPECLDLGCGTGLVGAEFRDIAERLTEIDLSRRMS